MGKQDDRCSHSAATVPVALTIAGSDSSAGAGVQADLKTFSAFAVYGLTAVTCVVAEIPGKVSRIEPVSADIVREQITVLCRNFPIAAMKTGLLCSTEIISAVAEAIRACSTDILSVGQAGVSPAVTAATRQNAIPLVIDPVMIATSGDLLLSPDAIELYESKLFPLATLITPNLDEATRLLGEPVCDLQAMREGGRKLERKYGVSILLKGGHLTGSDAIDLLFHHGKLTEFSAPFVRGVATHGTGCTYSAAITSGLASGLALEDAVGYAKKFVTASIARHFRWTPRPGKDINALNQSI